MRKKSSHRKSKASRPAKKLDSFSLYFSLLRHSMSVIVIIVLTALLTPFFTSQRVGCANSISCKQAPKYETEANAIGTYNNKPIRVPNVLLAENENTSPVLGVATSQGKKHIYVNLATQTLAAYEGEKLFMQTFISSGLWGKTPQGDFTIWSKFRATRMSGGSGADYYDLPNVPYVMFFSNNEVAGSAGFSLHGTYWHNNFGHAMSHGCVNMKTTDAMKLYEWADGPSEGKKGTTISIFGNQP